MTIKLVTTTTLSILLLLSLQCFLQLGSYGPTFVIPNGTAQPSSNAINPTIEGTQTIEGTNERDTLYGTQNDDHIEGHNKDDIMYGHAGDDEIEGGKGDDLLYGEEGEDILQGETKNDKLFGGDGNDELDGGKGNDELIAEEGNDRLEGGLDADNFDCGLGKDIVVDFNKTQGDSIKVEGCEVIP
jgi:Ca2+-binding RTX toxin-like protein